MVKTEVDHALSAISNSYLAPRLDKLKMTRDLIVAHQKIMVSCGSGIMHPSVNGL